MNDATRAKTFARETCARLGTYKREVLGIEVKGKYVSRGGAESYHDHILAPDLAWLNLPEPFRGEIQQYVSSSGIKLHVGFHHLNSSQVLALALFYPYLKYAPDAFAQALGTTTDGRFEFERIPSEREGTNVDVLWSDGGLTTYCEVKYTEIGFASCKNDLRHLGKLQEIYLPVLAPFIDKSLHQPIAFFSRYQMLRNLWLIARPESQEDRLVFLLPNANPGPNAQLVALEPFIEPSIWSRVSVVHLEDALAQLRRADVPSTLAGYADLLSMKYLPASCALSAAVDPNGG